MQLHHLEVEAFGPFGEAHSVDVDELRGAGLFLLTGPTGAGKSSVLDAICFGLYGVVPGTRHAARQLRSDHARPEQGPRIRVEFSVGGRRFRILRTAQWERPKKRGTGTTTQQASVLVEEADAQEPGGWRVLSTRLDESADLITRLLGMRSGQFTQVAMLPQGDFQRFLAAKSDERQEILQRLFRTDRFEAVERWVRERRLALAKISDQSREQVGSVLHRIAESAATTIPHAWSGDETAPSRQRLTNDIDWTLNVQSCVRADHAAAHTTLTECDDAAQQARTAHEEATALDAAQTRGRRARRELDELDHTAAEAARVEERLATHRRAAPVLLLGREATSATAEVAELGAATVRALTEAELPSTTSAPEIERRRRQALRTRDSLVDFAERQHELDSCETEIERQSAEHQAAESAVDRLTADQTRLPRELDNLQTRLEAAHAASAQLAQSEAEVDRATRAQQASVELIALRTEHERLTTQLHVRRDRHQELRGELLDLREARINAMAGELATGLAAGCHCPVCGSTDHPDPARPEPGVDAAAETAARRSMDDAAIEVESLKDAVRRTEAEIVTREQITAGESGEHWQRQVAEGRARLQQLLEQAGQADELREQRDRLQARHRDLADALAAATARMATAQAACAAARSRAHELTQARDRLLRHLDADTVSAGRSEVTSQIEQLETIADLMSELAHARTRLDRAEEAVTQEIATHGFGDWTEVAAAELTHDEAAELESRTRARADRAASAAAVLAEPDVVAALEHPPIDPDATRTRVRESTAARDRAVTHEARLQARVARLDALVDELSALAQAWEPVLGDLTVATEVGHLLEGRSDDADFRIRLSAFVLGERLAHVVAAANDRLARMGRDRFLLEQTDHGVARERRGGLGLRVFDAWTSTSREIGTLSGGETFIVSLALALGLADTVTEESGGIGIETLFIDEGFGSLDADSLEAVLDTLDSLRDGGRSVGVVSHVTEMRERIAAQLQVTSGPRGEAGLRAVLGHAG